MSLNSTPISSKTACSLPTTIAVLAPMQGRHGIHTHIWNRFWTTKLISWLLGISLHETTRSHSCLPFYALGTLRKSFLQAIAGCQVTMPPVTKSSFLVRGYCQCRSNLCSWSRLSRILPWCLSGSCIGWNDLQGTIILGWCGIFWFPIYNWRLDLSCQGMKNKFHCKFLVVFFSPLPDNFPQHIWAICWSFANGQALKDEVSGDVFSTLNDLSTGVGGWITNTGRKRWLVR